MYYIGLFLAIVSNVLFLISILQNDKRKVFKIQSIETVVNILKNIVLGGYSGASTQVFGLLRNILLSKGINQLNIAIALSIGQFIVGHFVNNHGLLGYLPIVASILYTIVANVTISVKTTKLTLVVNLLMWCVYSIIIKDWVSVATNLIFAVISAHSVIHYKEDVQRL